MTWTVITFTWLFTVVFMTQSSDPLYKTPPLFTTIFYKIGRSSADPAKDFRELGLGPEYVPLKGLFAYAAGSPMNDPAWRDAFLRKTGFGKVGLFYSRHPLRAVGFVWQDIKEFGPLNPDPGLLKYQRQNFSFSAWHAGRDYLFREYPFHIVFVFAASLCFCAACCVSAWLRERFPVWLCFLTIVLMALLALAVATLADAADTARHLFVFHVLTDVMLCFWLAALTPWLIAPAKAVKLARMHHSDTMQRVSQ